MEPERGAAYGSAKRGCSAVCRYAEDMEILVLALTIIGPLVGVWIGSHLSSRSSDRDWMREKRAEAYLELLDLLLEINQTFAVGLRVSHFQAESAREHGHDFEGVEDAWRGETDALDHVELRINMLGGKLTKVYRDNAHDLIGSMFDALDDDEITSEQWSQITSNGHALVEQLVEISRKDLGVGGQSKRQLF